MLETSKADDVEGQLLAGTVSSLRCPFADVHERQHLADSASLD